MAIIPGVLSPVSNVIDGIVPEKYSIKIQEALIRSGVYVKASDLITLCISAGIHNVSDRH